MPVTVDKPAPYTSPSTILDIIQRHRTRGLPTPVNNEVLGRGGISDSMIPRTLQSLQALDLIDESGNLTQVLEGLRLAPDAEFKKRLEEWLNAAYADVLMYVNPRTDDETRIRDAFRNYKPIGQQPRMVTLFLGLYAAAGIVSEKPVTRSSLPVRSRPAPSPVSGIKNKQKSLEQASTPIPLSAGLPPALQGLLSSLPADGKGWTQTQRDKFIVTFGAVIDFCFPIVEKAASKIPENEEED